MVAFDGCNESEFRRENGIILTHSVREFMGKFNCWQTICKKKTSHFYVSYTHQAVTKQCIKIDDDADQSASC